MFNFIRTAELPSKVTEPFGTYTGIDYSRCSTSLPIFDIISLLNFGHFGGFIVDIQHCLN